MKKVASIPVSDAAYIYTRSGNRSGSDDGFSGVWKVTVNGEEVKLQALDDDGDVVDIEIISIKNILGNYLVADTEAGRVLVNKTTNKVYKCPIHLTGESTNRVEEYPTGTLYYHDFNQIYKSLISEQSVTEEELLPEGQWGNDFLIGQDETLFYSQYYSKGSLGKVMTKGKRLYLAEGVMFGTVDHNIYSVEQQDSFGNSNIESPSYIYKWENSGDNEIVKKMICEIPNREVMCNSVNFGGGMFVPINNMNDNVVLFVGNSYYDSNYCKVYEFDGKSCVLKRTYTTTEEMEALNRMFSIILDATHCHPLYKTIGETNVYFDEGNPHNDGFAVSLDPVTYEIKCIPYEIPRNEYEVYTKRTEASWGKLLFTGLRYSDSSIVLGEIDTEGNVSIVSERASEYHITEYFALN